MASANPTPRSLRAVRTGLLALVAIATVGSLPTFGAGPNSSEAPGRVITIWHPMRPTKERDIFYDECRRFEKLHPEFEVRALYKEVEELRSAFQAAALAGEGPDLIYGPSDVLDTFHTMGLLQDMAPWYTDEQRADFVKGALTYLPALADPTKHELVQIGRASCRERGEDRVEDESVE